ncbi:hypothetical protein HHC25_10065 [Neisseria meningitidis]|nr:hypothetical protein [Neisseria meningitidis]
MNKTWKRQVFRHTALYTAILMFSHTGAGGGAGASADASILYCNERAKSARGKVGACTFIIVAQKQYPPIYLYE